MKKMVLFIQTAQLIKELFLGRPAHGMNFSSLNQASSGLDSSPSMDSCLESGLKLTFVLPKSKILSRFSDKVTFRTLRSKVKFENI